MSKNLCLKTRPKTDPYESWETPIGIYHVLKKYQNEENEAKNPYATWFCWCENEYNDMGDVYVAEIKRYGRRIK